MRQLHCEFLFRNSCFSIDEEIMRVAVYRCIRNDIALLPFCDRSLLYPKWKFGRPFSIPWMGTQLISLYRLRERVSLSLNRSSESSFVSAQQVKELLASSAIAPPLPILQWATSSISFGSYFSFAITRQRSSQLYHDLSFTWKRLLYLVTVHGVMTDLLYLFARKERVLYLPRVKELLHPLWSRVTELVYLSMVHEPGFLFVFEKKLVYPWNNKKWIALLPFCDRSLLYSKWKSGRPFSIPEMGHDITFQSLSFTWSSFAISE